MKPDKITQAAIICSYQSEELEEGIRVFRFNYTSDVERFANFCNLNKIKYNRPCTLRINVLMEDDIQSLMEKWWNEDPEMRYIETMCGQHYRFCVRLFQMEVTCPGEFKVGEAEAGNLIDAFKAAELQAKNHPRYKTTTS